MMPLESRVQFSSMPLFSICQISHGHVIYSLIGEVGSCLAGCIIVVGSYLDLIHEASVYRWKRGGAHAAFPGKFRPLNLSPHPSREGRGSLPGCSMWLRAKWVARGEDGGMGWVEDERNSTVMGLMFD